VGSPGQLDYRQVVDQSFLVEVRVFYNLLDFNQLPATAVQLNAANQRHRRGFPVRLEEANPLAFRVFAVFSLLTRRRWHSGLPLWRTVAQP